jgi:Uma2 family endonuclease
MVPSKTGDDPDVCFIAASRLPGGIPDNYLQIVPDFVIEIVSPNDRTVEVEQKLEEWLKSGARRVWEVYSDTKSAVAYQGLESVRVYGPDETINGGPVLPDLSASVSSLFA